MKKIITFGIIIITVIILVSFFFMRNYNNNCIQSSTEHGRGGMGYGRMFRKDRILISANYNNEKAVEIIDEYNQRYNVLSKKLYQKQKLLKEELNKENYDLEKIKIILKDISNTQFEIRYSAIKVRNDINKIMSK